MNALDERVGKRDQALVAAAWAVFAAAVAGILGPLLHGAFLSDDFVPLVLFRHWQDEGQFGYKVFSKLYTGLDAGPNNFYRPLSYASFALNYVTSGMEAGHWHALNVGLHVASGVMAGMTGVLAAGGRGVRAGLAAVAGAALFVFFAPGSEVVGWISGRFDATATFFSVLSCLLFVVSKRHGDAAGVVSVAAAFAAFLCKESAASLPFAILLLALVREGEARPLWSPRRWIAATWRALPWLLVAVLYLAARYAFFGSATRVYAGSTPMTAMFTAAYWTQLATSIPPWTEGRFPVRWHLPAMLVLSGIQVLLLAWAAFARATSRRARDTMLAMGAVVVLTILLVAPHVGSLPANGIGGRLLYQTAAFWGALAAAALAVARPAWPLALVSLALVGVNAAGMSEALARHDRTFVQMRALVSEVQREVRELPPGGYVLALVPMYHENIPFAVNAQGGLLMPPMMPRPITPYALVQIHDELAHIGGAVDKGLIGSLRRYPLFEVITGMHPDPLPREFPTRVTCWNIEKRRLVPLDVTPGEVTADWVAAIRAAMPPAGCGKPP